jgi:hypothetical protein
MLNRLVDPVSLHQGGSQVAVRLCITRGDPDGFPELGNGFVDLPLADQDVAGVVV